MNTSTFVKSNDDDDEDDNSEILKCTNNAPGDGESSYLEMVPSAGGTFSTDIFSSTDTAEPSGVPESNKLRRIMVNRRSARESRERRKKLLSKLQSSVDALSADNRLLVAENAQLRAQVKDLTEQLLYVNANRQEKDLNFQMSAQQQPRQNQQMNALEPSLNLQMNTEQRNVNHMMSAQQQPNLNLQMNTMNSNMSMGSLTMEQQLFQQQNILLQAAQREQQLMLGNQLESAQREQQLMMENQLQAAQLGNQEMQSHEQQQQDLFLAAYQRAKDQNQFRWDMPTTLSWRDTTFLRKSRVFPDFFGLDSTSQVILISDCYIFRAWSWEDLEQSLR